MLAAAGTESAAPAAGSASADAWFPHPAGATWKYVWKDTVYNPSGTVENVVVQRQQGLSFTLAWADTNDTPPSAGTTSIKCPSLADLGVMGFEDTNSGLINTNWNSCPPPLSMPILCSSGTNCANSLAGSLYNLIWGNRVPVLSEPLLQGTKWSATGGAADDVSSTSTFVGMATVKVPAFPSGVLAAVVRSQIIQGGAIGDPYGSGTRTTWWVYGVGPVQVVFDHPGGGYDSGHAPITTISLLSTNLRPTPPPPDANYFPLTQGLQHRYQWTNSKYLRRPEVEAVTVARVANRSADVTVKSLSGPLRVAGAYLFTIRNDGLTNLAGSSAAATRIRFPPLGDRRHFLTPIDLMAYGFNPVLPAYPEAHESWSGDPADFDTYGATGSTRVIGLRTVRVPAGTFRALEVSSVLTQRGHPFGSGVRTCWFAPGRGLVKLVFDHRDGSVSLVELIR
jgi:hypothetical protein